MDVEYERRVLQIATRALGLARGARGELLAEACDGDPALRVAVEQVLAEASARSLGSGAERSAFPSSDLGSELVSRLADRERRLHGAPPRYREDGEVARGGQGSIVRVWDEDLRRHLAMKVALGQANSSSASPQGEGSPPLDERTLGRFLEEAQVTGQLDHPGIVPVHELGVDDQGCVYFTMKLVKGRDLRQVFGLVREGREGWSLTRALGVLLRVCEAMSYAHAKGVIHRDLKPGNVMVGRFGEVYVMDWGLARVLGREGEELETRRPSATTVSIETDQRHRGEESPGSPMLTREGDVLGTPSYMSPEQALGSLDLMGPESDVYALGAMLYHLVTGQSPYSAVGSDVLAILRRLREGPPRPIRELAPDVPAELVAICERAMARSPSDRYGDMSLLADDLRAYLEHRVVVAYETGALAALRKWVGRNKLLSATMALVLVLLLGSGGGFAWYSRELEGKNVGLGEALGREQGLTATLQSRNMALDLALADARDQRLNADASAAEARSNARIAQVNAEHAERERANVMRLSAFQRLEDLQREADSLWPATPALLPDYDAWLTEASGVVAALEPSSAGDDKGHRAQLVELRRGALPRSEEQREAERKAHPRYAELQEMNAKIAQAEAALTGFRAGLGGVVSDEDAAKLARIEETIAGAIAARDALDAEVGERQIYAFSDDQDAWWHNQLTQLISEIEALADPETGLVEGVSPAHGWGVARRRRFAATVDERTVSSEQARRRWSEAIASIADREASPLYQGLQLSPQVGLLPIGPDPGSGLWEFWHVMSGTEPARNDDDELVLIDTSGIVLVLIPGGSFRMGDDTPTLDERPVHEVRLSPFFLSKYEMTQGQWQHLTGGNPSNYAAGSRYMRSTYITSWLHPVEQVSCDDARRTMLRIGLELPSEAQWEYAARAGTTTAWWPGDRRESLLASDDGVVGANLADRTAKLMGAGWSAIADWPEYHDGWPVHAPVNLMRPNPFGLHHVHGNVWELCRDAYEFEYYQVSPSEDPVNDIPTIDQRVIRGAGFNSTADNARSSNRNYVARKDRQRDLGIRPSRRIDP